MESNQVQMYQISKSEQSNNKQNVVLRALVGDPNRHKPLAQHPLPTTTVSQEVTPASMYTLETRYRPIPPEVLPQPTQTTLYYLDSKKLEPASAPTPSIIKEERDTSIPAEPEVLKRVEEKQEPPQTVFLEPKIISQPILYSIVGAKTLPVQNNQSIPTIKEVPSPFLYSITGQPHRPTTDISASTLNVATPVIDKSPILYSLVGSPRLQLQTQEPVKQVSQTQQQQQPSSSLYSVVGSPSLQPQIQEPVKQVLSLPQQPSPNLYSIVGNPTLIPPITQENTFNPPPPTQSVKVSSVQPEPILFTVVGESQVPTNIPKENRPPPAPAKKQANDVTMYTMVGDPNIPQTMTLPQKIEPLQPQKQPQQQQQQAQTPTLYTIVGKPNSPPEDINIQPKPPIRRKTPPPAIVPARRISRSLERSPATQTTTEEATSAPQRKNKRQARSKEPTIPKSETTFIPLPEYERSPRPRQPRTTPWNTSPGQIRHKPFNISHYDPLHLPDYISPYAYHPSKPYREQTYNPVSLPTLSNKRPERKPRPLLSEPRYQAERKYPYNPWTNHSLERNPVNTKQRSRLWDYQYQTQSDIDDDDDDDDDINQPKSNRKKQRYRRIRPRTPWIPVW